MRLINNNHTFIIEHDPDEREDLIKFLITNEAHFLLLDNGLIGAFKLGFPLAKFNVYLRGKNNGITSHIQRI